MHQLYREREYENATGPGLTVLVIYLRPSVRTPLLSIMADLGVFVVECVGDRWRKTAAAFRSDFAVVVGDCTAGHLQVVAEIAERVGGAVVGVSRTADQFPSFVRAGALACVTDEGTRDALAGPVEEVAKFARRLKELSVDGAVDAPSPLTVFDDVQFHLNPPLLVRQARSVALSDSECGALLALSERMGKPVSTETMEQRVSQHSGTVSPGYIKTIMLRIRRKVDSIGGDSGVLGAVRGFGYVLRS